MPRKRIQPSPDEALFDFLRRTKCQYLYMAKSGQKNRMNLAPATSFTRATIKTSIPRGADKIINLASGQWDPSGRIDPAYTNQALRSETMTSATWIKSAAAITVSDDSVATPSVRSGGVTNKVLVTAGGAAESIRLTYSAGALTNALQSFVIIVQEGNAVSFTLRIFEGSVRAQTLFTWVDGQLTIGSTTAGTAEVRNIPGTNKWYAAVYCTNFTTAAASRFDFYPAFGVTDGFTYAMGAQIVQGVNRILPYYPTTTFAAGPNADVFTANVGLSTLPGSQRTYAMMYEQDYPLASYSQSGHIFGHRLDGTGGSQDWVLLGISSGAWKMTIRNDGTDVINLKTHPVVTGAGPHVAVVSVMSGGTNFYIDGVPATLDTSTFSLNGTTSQLNIGSDVVQGNQIGMRVRYFSCSDRAVSIDEAHILRRLILEANP